jgi:uncharacterized protein (DUF2141 family)
MTKEVFISKPVRWCGFIFLLIMSLVLSKCANQVAPTGGSKDEQPPKVIKESPQNLNTNFSAKEIVLTFDEYIMLNDANNQIYISPFPGKKPEYNVKNKQLKIKFTDTLSPNTTYTIYFGNAIRDINEGNVLFDYTYVFSSGPVIDSLLLKGIVVRALDNTPVNGAVVALYFSADDSVIYKQRPDYFTRCNKEGFFEIKNIKSHRYKIIAFEDVNQDLKYDVDENIAFSDSLIAVTDTGSIVALRLFKPQRATNKVLSARQMGPGRISVAMANAITGLQIKLVNSAEPVWHLNYNASRDTCIIFFNPAIKDSLRMIVSTEDSRDTITVLFKSSGTKNNSKDTLSTYNNKPLRNNLSIEKQKSVLYFGQMLKLIPQDIVDSLIVNDIILKSNDNKPINGKLFLKNHPETNEQFLEIQAALQPDKQYSAIMPRGLWRFKNGQLNDSTSLTFLYTDISATGNLNLSLYGTGMNRQFIFELRNKNGELAFKDTFSEDKRFVLKNLPPGTYRARAIADANENGVFDNGNYYLKLQPEAVIVFTNEIVVRANWDLDVELSLKNIRKK